MLFLLRFALLCDALLLSSRGFGFRLAALRLSLALVLKLLKLVIVALGLGLAIGLELLEFFEPLVSLGGQPLHFGLMLLAIALAIGLELLQLVFELASLRLQLALGTAQVRDEPFALCVRMGETPR